jgi:tetratricopeptide (TPR) repeat protein
VRALLGLFLVLLTAAAQGAAQAQAPGADGRVGIPEGLLTRPISLRDGIGRAHDAAGTTAQRAQAFYDQGSAFLHSRAWVEAARSFNEALRIDPRLAVAHLGISRALAELNAPGEAQAAFDRARALAPSASAHDRVHIELHARQMAADASGGSAALAAHRNAVDAALAAHPRDVELWVLRGTAQAPDGIRGEHVAGTSIGFFDKAIELAPDHAGAHHYLAHAYENTGRHEDALRHANEYVRLAPQMPHARHAQGHALRAAGRVAEAVEAFEAADRLHSESFEREGIPAALVTDYAHNLGQLGACYRYLGRFADAGRVLRIAFALPAAAANALEKRAWPDLLVSRGRAMEGLAAARGLAAEASPLARAVGHVAAGHALLAAGYTAAAEAEQQAARQLIAGLGAAGAPVAPALEVLQGEIYLRRGRPEAGRAMLDEAMRSLREAAQLEDWAHTLFSIEGVARAARDVGDWDFAGFAARQLAAQDARYAGAHYALALVAEHNGEADAAQAGYGLAEKYWTSADADVPELQTIRRWRR